MVDRVGQQLGNYRLVSLLGQGGYAEVYLGQHVRFKQQAAIKVLHAHLSSQEIEHFQQEAETIATLAHPSIVRVFDFDVQDGIPFLVMDYAPNGSLRQRYPKGKLVPLSVIVSCVKQVAAALQYAHDKKFIHRDVKPENMLIGQLQEVLLSDFGIATIAHSSSSLSTGAEGTSGTLAYMAPEQIEGHPRAASDQYALGVVVYEWLCGERPFEGSVSELIAQHVSMPPLPLRERVPAIPAEVEQVVLRALAKDPKLRFASVQDFVLALEVASTAASTGSTRPMLASKYAEAQHTTKHNLPAHLTPLLGREQEVVEACTILRRPEVRLVTLTGPGGIGKTRLALHLATELLADFAGGVYFVSLAPTNTSELVIPAIAQTLDVKESRALPLMDLLKAFLKDKHVLLVLDNFEHLLPAAPQLADLLTSCPHLNILVTSRAVLHVQGEQEFPVPSLAVPDLAHLPESEALTEYSAVALFLQRARAVKLDFQLTKANAHVVVAICTRLDGLPLAIELAAARIKLLPPAALLARLEHRLAVLTGGAQNLPTRQQTLRNTIAWSYDLLEASEQRLFRRLCGFVGGTTLSAIEAVSAALGNEPESVLDAIASLIDKSLLRQSEPEGEQPRFVMLETIREYGWEMLSASGEAETTQRAHAAYYLALAEEAAPKIQGPQTAEWLRRLEQEHDNLRAAMNCLFEQGDAAMALRMGTALAFFWELNYHYDEGWNVLSRSLVGSEDVAVLVRARALVAAGWMASLLGHFERGDVLAQEGLALSRAIGNTAGMGHAVFRLAQSAAQRGNVVAARSLFEESIMLNREAGNKSLIAWSLLLPAMSALFHGEYAGTRARLEESLALFREVGNPFGTAFSLHVLAWYAIFGPGDLPLGQAHLLAEESLALFRDIGSRSYETLVLAVLGEITFFQGDTTTARQLLEQSCTRYREVGNEIQIAWTLSLLGRVLVAEGDLAGARAVYEESLILEMRANTRYSYLNIAPALEGLAAVVAAQGEPTWAARLWGRAEALRETINTPLPPLYRTDYDHAVALARAGLDEPSFAAAWAEGRAMTLEQVVVARGPVTIPEPLPTSQPAAATPEKLLPTYPDGLTAREVEVLLFVAKGLTNAQIAEQLVISPRTVNTQLTSIYGKIRVSSRAAATRYAIEHQFV
jgi:predicted ATPase/DNA-binding CsgD family transcriptional regulator/tRNA A-37 threonylcarbamoyl transferase component Bud32